MMMMIENIFNSLSNEIWMKIVKINKMLCSVKFKKKKFESFEKWFK